MKVSVAALITLLFTACLFISPKNAYAADKEIYFDVKGQKVYGTLAVPEHTKKVPIVLMLHGYTASRNESVSEYVPEGLFGRMADELEKQGIASLRIDMRGSGKSNGTFKFSDMTIESEIEDALAAINYISKLDYVDKNRISVMGLSLGGIVTTATVARSPIAIRSAVLWNPGINPPAAFITMFGKDNVQKATQNADAIYVAPLNGTDIAMKGEFYRSLFRVVPAAELAQYKGPFLLAIGTSDNIVWHQPTSAKALLSYHKGKHELYVTEAGHTFDCDSSEVTVNKVIDKSVKFIVANN